MFSIIGADGQEYGPVTAAVLTEWIEQARANAQTRVRAGEAGSWKPLGEFGEFAAALEARYGPPVAPDVPLPVPTGSETPPAPLPAKSIVPAAPVVSHSSRASALEQLRPPAIFMMVVAVCGLALELLGFMNLSVFQLMPFEQPPWFGRAGSWGMLIQLPFLLLSIGLYSLSIFAAVNMLQLKRWGFCLAGAIALVVPCTGCCCCLGLVSGLWGMIVLTRPDVRAAFAP